VYNTFKIILVVTFYRLIMLHEKFNLNLKMTRIYIKFTSALSYSTLNVFQLSTHNIVHLSTL
jgi:hypothetical protein